MSTVIHWTELLVTDSDGITCGTLADMVRDAPANFDTATIEDGRIVSWPDWFISAPGEEPNWDTPRVDVDWGGFPRQS